MQWMSMSSPGHYELVCPVCGSRRPDDGLLLECPLPHEPALLRTEYAAQELLPCPDATGIYRYRRWLPGDVTLPGSARTVAYRSERLGAFLGLRELWVAFNGYWPQRGANLPTATFKDLEAYAVLSRSAGTSSTLVVASAGNTASAFAELCSRLDVPCVIVVGPAALPRLRLRTPLAPCVRIVLVANADYAGAITFADALAAQPGHHAEGGTRNVGRRDGLATTLYPAVEAIGGLPRYYFQAIGSGAGAIAVHEGARRIGTGPAPRMFLCQNAEFAPVHDAWRAERNGGNKSTRNGSPDSVYATELTNRRPPYAIRGGVRDVLVDSDGDVLTAGTSAAAAAAALFEDLEGIDVEPAAGVALACLRTAVAGGAVDRDAPVLLNVTGGGRRLLAAQHALVGPQPCLEVDLARDGLQRSVELVMREEERETTR
jgi:cysteate synthase